MPHENTLFGLNVIFSSTSFYASNLKNAFAESSFLRELFEVFCVGVVIEREVGLKYA